MLTACYSRLNGAASAHLKAQPAAAAACPFGLIEDNSNGLAQTLLSDSCLAALALLCNVLNCSKLRVPKLAA